MAVALNLEGQVEMSCTAGLAIGVKAHVRKATSGRAVIAVDGCEIACVRGSLDKLSVTPHAHIIATKLGLRKRTGELCSDEAIGILRDAVEQALPR